MEHHHQDTHSGRHGTDLAEDSNNGRASRNFGLPDSLSSHCMFELGQRMVKAVLSAMKHRRHWRHHPHIRREDDAETRAVLGTCKEWNMEASIAQFRDLVAKNEQILCAAEACEIPGVFRLGVCETGVIYCAARSVATESRNAITA